MEIDVLERLSKTLTIKEIDYIVAGMSESDDHKRSLPALLRAAGAACGLTIRKALTDAGYADVPRGGAYVIGAMDRDGVPLSNIVRNLRVSKQAAGQLIDTLVLRGYLDRAADPQDRRRLVVVLTERGRAAAAVTRSAIERLDAELLKRVGAEHLTHARTTLAILADYMRKNHS